MIYTSYFNKYNQISHIGNCISIAIGTPVWFKEQTYSELFPTWKMVKDFKIFNDEKKYIEEYYNILNKLNPQKVFNDLNDNIILCWEKSGKFCHRHLVVNWLRENSKSFNVEFYSFEI